MARKRRALHSGIDESYWDRLDNTAKMFPAITSRRSPNVYRLSAVLLERVDPDILQAALEKALAIMPSFSVNLHRGLFWYYFDMNNERPKVCEERTYPCVPIYRQGNKGFLFRVTYYECRINLEMYHALTDGLGAVSFMRLLVYCYFNIKEPDKVPEDYIRREADVITRDFGQDCFALNVSDNSDAPQPKKEREAEAYHIGGYRYDGTRLGVLAAILPTDDMLALAKSHGATLSEYICALLIWSIYNTSYRRSMMNRPITVSIPVNLRGMFDSSTLRNFFGHMNVSVKPARTASFEDILEQTKECFKKCLTRRYFERQITSHVNIERIPGIKFVPLFIKDVFMRYFYKKNEKLHTITFSNIGRITLPPMLADKVERFEVIIGASQKHVKKAALCSYEGKLALVFSSTVDNNSIEQFMLSHLAGSGIDVVVCSNETPMPRRDKLQIKADRAAAKSARKALKTEGKAQRKAVKAAKKAEKKAIKCAKKADNSKMGREAL